MTTRKEFIGAGALIAAATPLAAQAQTATPASSFDLAAFNAMLDKKVRHKNLFAIRKVEQQSGIDAMEGTLGAYQKLGVSTSDLLFAAVLYHGASIAFAFDDAIWDQYIRVLLKKVAAKQSASELDLATVIGDTKSGNPVKAALADLVENSNARFFVCNNALKGWTQHLAKTLGHQPSNVYSAFTGALLPNASIVPAGVWAVHAIQEHGFTLLPTT